MKTMKRRYTQTELVKILRAHAEWLRDPDTNQRADLTNADLSGADLRCANLADANLAKAVLSGADLAKAVLSGADLTNAVLSGADMTGSDLTDVNLSYANLTDVNLSYAKLTDVNLSYADLTGSNLAGTDLSYANLTDVNLSYADLTGSNLAGSNFADADMTGVKGIVSRDEAIKNLDRIREIVLNDTASLDMRHCHCGTTHCLAGHAQLNAGLEESKYTALIDGSRLIWPASHMFYATNARAIAYLQNREYAEH